MTDTSQPSEDADIRRRLRDGDESVLTKIRLSIARPIKDLIRKRYPSLVPDIEDILQETMTSLWTSRATLHEQNRSSVCTLAMTIAEHLCIDSLRRQTKVRPNSPTKLSLQEKADESELNQGDNNGSSLSDVRRCIDEFVDGLSDRDREIFMTWLYNRGADYAPDLAAKYGITCKAIRVARGRLAKKFKQRYPHLADGRMGSKGEEALLAKLAASLRPGSAIQPEDLREIASSQAENPECPLNATTCPSSPPVGALQSISTGLAALDTLLGGGILPGSVILLRGQAGTGKTTLALQIARNLMARGFYFVFAAIEDEPEVLLNQITQSYWGKTYSEFLGPNNGSWHVTDLTTYFDREIRGRAEKKTITQWCVDAGLANSDIEQLMRTPEVIDRLIAHLLLQDASRSATRDTLREMDLDDVLAGLWSKLPVQESQQVVLVVDSLNALINSAAARFRFTSERQAILAVLNSFRNWRRKRRSDVTVVFLAEEDAHVASAAASYLADVVIALRTEEMEQTIYESQKRSRKLIQEMRFCKILKGRGLPIQSRSCGYEFASGTNASDGGIVFHPTYAAPGVISLFHENAPMLEVVRTLRNNDGPALFPQVVVQEFSRAALQRVFSVNRHRKRIVLRHPLMVSNVDEYWLKRLRENDLLQPIPAEKLQVFSLSLNELGPERNGTSFIRELDEAKQQMFKSTEGHQGTVYYGVPQIANVGMMICRRDLLKQIGAEVPETWEDVERICKALRDKNLPDKLLLELRSYDTFLATALELGWSHGAFWRTVRDNANSARVQIQFDQDSHVAFLIAALIRIKHWIYKLGIVPRNCSVDPQVHPDKDWVFARHWYSTWVDVCTHRKSKKSQVHEEYAVCPIPIAASYKQRCGSKHHSAWGEWYLAILRGSENVDLGVELINNLMTARKISERALSGAALPTVERFYEMSDENCPGTDCTFREIRERFFVDAKSRSDFEDYPQLARVFSAVLRTVITNPKADVVDAVRTGLENVDPTFRWPETADIKDKLHGSLPAEFHRYISKALV